jgi:hypothetical protein
MSSFDEMYPALSEWISGSGWVEVGAIDGFSTMIQVLDGGGLIWEGESSYPSVDAAFRAAEAAVVRWIEENG